MAQYRGTISGARGPASRLGTKKSGLVVTADGWDIGARVNIWFDEASQCDRMVITLTGGSNSTGPQVGTIVYSSAMPTD